MVKKTAAFRQRRAADTARWRKRLRKRAQAEFSELYRERAIARARAAERDPGMPLQ